MKSLLSQTSLVETKGRQGSRTARGTSVPPGAGSGTASGRRIGGARGPMGGTPRTWQRGAGRGKHARRVGLDSIGTVRARRRLRFAPGSPQSIVLGNRDRDAGARHRRGYRDVQRLRCGADPSDALCRRGPSRDDLGLHGQERRHNETQPHTGGVDRVAASQFRIHRSRDQPAGRRDAVRRRRTRTGSGAKGDVELLERARRAADARTRLHRGRRQQRRARGCDQPRAMAAPLWRGARYRRTQDFAQRRALRGDRRDAAGLLFHAFARHRRLDAGFVSCLDANELHVARRADRRAAQARRDAGAGKTVHGGIEFAGDREGFPRPPFGDRHGLAGRNRGQNTGTR